jgi:hypothetical protein
LALNGDGRLGIGAAVEVRAGLKLHIGTDTKGRVHSFELLDAFLLLQVF